MKPISFSMSTLFTNVKEWLRQSFQPLTCTETDGVVNKTDDHEGAPQWVSKINREVLAKMMKAKDCECLSQAGGVDGVALALGSDSRKGIPGDSKDLHIRRKVFGSNMYVETLVPTNTFMHFIFEGCRELSTTILLCSALLSLVFGIRKDGWRDGWCNGLFTFLSTIAIITVTAVCNFRQTKLINEQSNESPDIQMDVIRQSGEKKQISISKILVGDVVRLKTGCQIPADGLLVREEAQFNPNYAFSSLVIEEGDDMYVVDHLNPFLSFGAKIVEVEGSPYRPPPAMLVTAVGINTTWGMDRQLKRQILNQTSFQTQFIKLSSYKEIVSMVIALLLLVVSFVEALSQKNTHETQNSADVSNKKTSINELMTVGMKISQAHNVGLRSVATAATTFLLAIPEGFSLVVTLLVIYSRKQLMRIVRSRVHKWLPCVTAGYVTTIFTDKTSFLMENEMKVTEFRLGKEVVDASTLPSKIIEMMCHGIGLNVSSILLSSPDEKAIVSWAETNLGMNMEELKSTNSTAYVEASKSRKKGVGVWIRKKGEDSKAIDVHWRGYPKMILAKCSDYYESNGIREFMNNEKRIELERIVQDMESNGLQCIAFAHKQVIEEKEGAIVSEVNSSQRNKDSKMNYQHMTLLGLVGLEFLFDPQAKRAVQDCRNAGINVIMVSNDNMTAAKALASKCGILGSYAHTNQMVVDGEEFQSYSAQERTEMADKICVMASCSSFNKLLLVQCLKQKGEVVAVTGVRMRDAPVLEEADLRLSVGTCSIPFINEISDIVIMDNNLSAISTALRWGRFTHDNIQKVIQLNLTSNIAGLTINLISTVTLGEEAAFTTSQMLLVNLVVDCVGALALVYEVPSKAHVVKPPVGRNEPLVTNVMWRNILAQAMFQIAIVLTLHFKGSIIFATEENVCRTMAFNTFIFRQAFNVFNARKIKEKNIFSGFQPNICFYGAVGLALVLQKAVMESLGKLFDLEKLNWCQWGSCLAVAAVSVPVGIFTKCIPVPDLNLNTLSCFTRLQYKIGTVFSYWNDVRPSSESLPLVNTKDA